MKLISPTGSDIVGTLESLPGTCGINNSEITRNADGTFEIEHDGTGTNIHWNDQKTVIRDGQRIFVDEDGAEWKESELVLADEDAGADDDDGEGEE